ncbi:hypothetical protein Poli38472_013871 [Pythium oligandrum]|uniref:DUF2817 domain-containing protein n=1 Tax=Pythium oligandrum TaxID=41045 RepID=A0A8K1FBR8_PYTOL|nr:hypothetical protein Poli38472_013871 [Pythium oligandrum]|eukprot:TMW55109.1 hypothetical protein Poli38472_013871 [Pythium oligandrum]
MSFSWKATTIALLLALGVHIWNDFAPWDAYFPSSTIKNDVEQHFSETYYQARAQFRKRAFAAHAEVYAVPLEHLSALDLTIDVAIIPGSNEKAILHISGTHGVEGFAGSGIQCGMLEILANQSATLSTDSPTLIFVHALNPYGMAMLRRFNEHNVDLNRNFLKPEDFEKRRGMDPNAFGYADLDEPLNPKHPTRWGAWVHTHRQLVQVAWTKGLTYIKRAVVGGTYHFSQGIFYGGEQLEPSGRALFQVLDEHLNMEALRVMGIIDVHTGLGPSGYDTLLLKTSKGLERARGIFQDRQPITSVDDEDSVTSGYDTAVGFLCSGLELHLPRSVKTVCLAQEFGTVPGFVVLRALIHENAMYHHAPTRRLPYAERLRDAFYLHTSVDWKTSVLTRGITVWQQLYTYVDDLYY